MSTFQKRFLAAIVKSLLRGKSLLQALIGFWAGPFSTATSLKSPKGNTASPSQQKDQRSTKDFLDEAESLLLGSVGQDSLVELSHGLMKQFLERLQSDPLCMLPSYSHQLPKGTEHGRFLTLDVGGSTLRVALVELRGRDDKDGQETKIVSMRSFYISAEVKGLIGMDFFYWMGERILETVQAEGKDGAGTEKPLPMALAWSFPIEQTSLACGKLQIMGKGFSAYKGLIGQDMGDILQKGCSRHGLNVELQAILNDSSACLLSRSYSHASTRFGLILGTGFNIAAYLPVSVIGRAKFGDRPESWFEKATHCVVNSEIGMFGHDILPLTRWDHQLLEIHPNPTLQPLETVVSGMYLGEICRWALIEGIETTGVFRGLVPESLREPYSLTTELLARIQEDTSAEFADSCHRFSTTHPSLHKPTFTDMAFVRRLASLISTRSSALVATTIYTFSKLRVEGQRDWVATISESSSLRSTAEADRDMAVTTVAFNGGVIESYPGYLESCQTYLDNLLRQGGSLGQGPEKINLVSALESSLTGAAVALASLQSDDA